MKVLCFALLVVLLAAKVVAQSGSDSRIVPVRIKLVRVDPECTLGGVQDLDYGTVQVPGLGEGTRTAKWDPVPNNGKYSYVDDDDNELAPEGNPMIGKLSLSSLNAGYILINVGFVESDSNGKSDTDGSDLRFRLRWAYSKESGGPFTLFERDFRFTREEGDTGSRHFQFGGDVFIPEGAREGEYGGKILVTVSCP